MTSPELEIVDRLLARLGRLRASALVDVDLLGELPADLAGYEALPPARQSAARATLKSFEQVEDQLARAFRAIPKVLGEDSERWLSRDTADFMEKLRILDNAAEWGRIVRLRNQLVHDYPLDPQVQLDRLVEAIGHLPLLVATIDRLAAFVRDELPGKLP